MKTFEYLNPTQIAIQAPEMDIRMLASQLTYDDPDVAGEIRRLKNSDWFISKYGEGAYVEKMRDLKSRLKVCLLQKREDDYVTLSGFAARLSNQGFECTKPLVRQLEGDRRNFPALRKAKDPRYYQSEAVEALIGAGHAAISLPTGSGKSWCAEDIVRHHGLSSLVMAPTVSIAGQLHEQFLDAFGPKRVGLYGDGKHQSNRQIVVGIAASLRLAKEDHLKNLMARDVFFVDESHLVPADTFSRVCNVVAAQARHRYFVSATQIRTDGTEILLEGITGPGVYSKTLEELVNSTPQYLARPRFFTVDSVSPSTYWNGRWEDVIDRHFYSNAKLHATAAAIANKLVATNRGPVLILVDHVEQFQYLFGGLKYNVGFAHGPIAKQEVRDKIHPEFHKSDVKGLVAQFNAGQLPILVGTSCITTGTDLRPTGSIVYLMAGESEIKFRQCVGRGTRLVPGKTSFNFVDFNVLVDGVHGERNMLHRHFLTRCSYYKPFEVRQLALG